MTFPRRALAACILCGLFPAARALAAEETAPLRAHVIPTGYDQGRFTALVQIVVPGSPTPRSSWEITATLSEAGRKSEEFSGRIEVNAPGVPLVLEKAATFAPGTYEILARARNTEGGESISGRFEGEWPDPNAGPASVGPIAVLQEAGGAFRRDDQSRTSGSLARARSEPLRTDVRSALLAIVCGGKSARGALRVGRGMLDRSEMQFPDVVVDLESSRCGILQDLIPADALTPGFYRYRIRVFDGDQEVATGYRGFSSARPGP